jgi:ferredoxin
MIREQLALILDGNALGGFKLAQTPEEFNPPEKTSRQNRDPQPEISKADHPGRDPCYSADLISNSLRHESDAASAATALPIDSLNEDTDMKGFMSPAISEELRRIALRKFFHLPKFNQRDGLDDYDENFRSFQDLGDLLTSDMRYHLERLAERKTGQRPMRYPLVTHDSETVEELAGVPDSRSEHGSPDKITETIPGIEIAGVLYLQPDLCAHRVRGQTGCTRCLDACPASAIRSTGDTIQIDPKICHQEGLCATVCPTDAIMLSKPDTAELLPSIQSMLATHPDETPAVIFHGAGRLPAPFEAPVGRTLFFPVDSIESIGMDICLATLACGASHAAVLVGDDITSDVFDILQTQITQGQKILEGLGLEKERIQMVRLETVDWERPIGEALSFRPVRPTQPARFEPVETKRSLMFQSVDHLYVQSSEAQPLAVFADGAPFGEVIIDPETCTLCLACVAVCPARALYDGGDVPQIRFLEENCVQCGLCRRACPENAIRLSPRMVFDPKVRSALRILNQAEAFCCVSCGKPFASRAIVDKMVQKLSGHWMYRDEAAKKRLLMCRACRAQDFFEAGAHS